ncbi:hypothetical protein ACYB2G_003234 [Salmonella enterica subsp. enterica serovar Chester]|nr:hypothetical protein [Enterobacter ludwigii]MIU42335.1 hypothetical protein [Salmonella enterica subsp. enterica serovar Virchow]WNI79033.1 hypothetical protein RIK61_23015 [Enterobacter ludwigii]HCJ5732750.1 hypothetical protein [Escherichia coli]
MGERFDINAIYNIVVNPGQHLEEVNAQLRALNEKAIQFDAIYTIGVNPGTNRIRVEGKRHTGTQELDIETIEAPIKLTDAVYNGTVMHTVSVPVYSIANCAEHVKGWSKERGILDNGKLETQITKFFEEFGEIATGISKNKPDLIMDGIGDALVVLVNILELGKDKLSGEMTTAEIIEHGLQLQVDDVADVEEHFDDNGYPHHLYLHATEIFATAFIRSDAGFDQLNWALYRLAKLALYYRLDIRHCFSLAWHEIKDRKGYLNADGIFVKEADLAK